MYFLCNLTKIHSEDCKQFLIQNLKKVKTGKGKLQRIARLEIILGFKPAWRPFSSCEKFTHLLHVRQLCKLC